MPHTAEAPARSSAALPSSYDDTAVIAGQGFGLKRRMPLALGSLELPLVGTHGLAKRPLHCGPVH